MVKIIYKGSNRIKIKEDVLKAFNFVYKLFLIKTPTIIVRVYDDRVSFNKQLKTRTADWIVANASDDNQIDILSPLALKNESTHKASEFLAILKHEFTHVFIDSLAKDKIVPKWLEEGLAQCLAKQYKNIGYLKEIDSCFCKKLGTSRGWYKRANYEAYPLSALFVYFLIKKHSFNKIKKLLLILDKKYNYNSFKKKFFEVYDVNLEEEEKLFIREFRKQIKK